MSERRRVGELPADGAARTTGQRRAPAAGRRAGLLLRLQNSVGNRAVNRLIAQGSVQAQRAVGDDPTTVQHPVPVQADDEEKASGGKTEGPTAPPPGGLHGSRWGSNALLQATARNAARVHAGSDPEAVRLVQQALVDVQAINAHKYNLGAGGPAGNGVDGTYGGKTGAAVQAFKRDESLGSTQFTDVGPGTMHRLDDLLDGGPGPGPDPVPKDSDPDEPQRLDPAKTNAKNHVPPPRPEPTLAGATLSLVLVGLLRRKPPDMLLVFSALRPSSVALTYDALRQLKGTDPAEFAILKTQLQGLSGSLADRLRVIVDGTENDEDMAVLDWKQSRAAKLGALPPAEQNAILLAYDPRHPTLMTAIGSAGFQSLLGTEQDQFLLYVGGANVLSRRAGQLLKATLADPKFDRSKAKSFRDFRTAEKSVDSLEETTDTLAKRPTSKTAPADGGKHAYQSKPAGLASETSVMTIGAASDPAKSTIPVFRPKADKLKPTLNYHSFDDVQNGLSTLPPRNAKEIKRIDIEPDFNPQDAHWKVAYKDKDFTSYMTAGADQVIRVYPSKQPLADQAWVEGSFIHESGHIISERAFGRGTAGPKWKPWKDAMKSDVIHPSDYALKSPAEDFSEMVQMFQMEKGRLREKEIRKMFPARMAILDSMKLT